MTSNTATARGRLPHFSSVLFFSTLVTLLAGLSWTITTRRSLSSRVGELRAEHLRLRGLSSEWKQDAAQAARDKDMLIRVFRHCRTADDIPQLGGDRIVANMINGDSVAFYLPGGGHKLAISTSWEPVKKTQSGGNTPGLSDADIAVVETPDDKSDSDVLKAGKRSWTIDLIGQQGYFFAINGDINGTSRKETKIQWKLSSNATEFKTLTQTLPLSPIRFTGASWSMLRVAEFPNQVDFRTLTKSASGVNSPRPLRIGRWTKYGRFGKNSMKINFELTVSSDSPSVISATRAKTLFVLKKER